MHITEMRKSQTVAVLYRSSSGKSRRSVVSCREKGAGEAGDGIEVEKEAVQEAGEVKPPVICNSCRSLYQF